MCKEILKRKQLHKNNCLDICVTNFNCISLQQISERDNQALPLVELFSSSSSNPQRKKIQLAILTAGIQYLALHKDISPFCGIDFNDLPIEELREALQVVIDELDQR